METDLNQIFKNPKLLTINAVFALEILQDVARALLYLHSRNIVASLSLLP